MAHPNRRCSFISNWDWLKDYKEAERLVEVVRGGGGARSAPQPVDEEGDRGAEV
jgi:hypothetical protein